jgi:hypothetical protein
MTRRVTNSDGTCDSDVYGLSLELEVHVRL